MSNLKTTGTGLKAKTTGVDILNAIRSSMPITYQDRIPEATKNNIKAYGNSLKNYPVIMNNFVDILVNKIGLTVQLILKDNNFKSYVRSSKMKFNSNDFNDIYSQALSIFDNNFLKEGDTLFRLVGVGLQNLEDEKDNSQQMSIFDNFDDINEKYATKLLVHQLNRKMNKGIFTTAGEILKEKNGNK